MSDIPTQPLPPAESPAPPNWVQVRYPDGGKETFSDVTTYTETRDEAGNLTSIVFFGSLEPGGETEKHEIAIGAGMRVSTKTVA